LPKENTLNYKIAKKIAKETDKTRKLFADFGRICEVEDSEIEWFDLNYYSKTGIIPDLNYLSPSFKILNIYFSEVDISVYKICMIAQKPG